MHSKTLHPSGGVFSSNETSAQPFGGANSGKAFTSGEKSSKNMDIDMTTNDKKSKKDVESINDQSLEDDSKDRIDMQ